MLIFVLGLCLGLILGSLVDCLASRSIKTSSSKKEQSFWGRSYCESCKKTLKWYDLFPVVSYFALSGRCRYCKKKISSESLFVEIIMALLIGAIFYVFVPSNILILPSYQIILVLSDLAFKVFVSSVLAILFITDIKKGLIPDRISIPAIIITFLYLLVINAYKVYLLYQSLASSSLGKYLLPPFSDYFQRHALIDASSLLTGLGAALIITIFFGGLIFITRGRGMGGGDLKLGILIGLALGLPNALFALFLAFVLGSIAGVSLIIARRKHFGQTIPFGPFLSIGAYIILVWGQQIVQGYLNFRLF